MKKLLIKIICFLVAIIFVGAICIGCNEKDHSGDIATPDSVIPTMGVINISATERESIAPTVKPTQPATEAPTITPTEVKEEEEEIIYYSDSVPEVGVKVEEDYYEVEAEAEVEEYLEEEYPSTPIYSPSEFQRSGVIDWGGWTWTYYSQNILPGEGLYIPGRHVDSNGYVCDENGYLCLASSTLSWGTVVNTPFGKSGRVYDSGCASYILDVYVAW